MTLLAADAAGLRFVDGDDLVLKARTESAAEIMARLMLIAAEQRFEYPPADIPK